MNSETNFDEINNETARNSNKLPNLGANSKEGNVITPATAATGGTEQTKKQSNEIEKNKPDVWSINDFAGVHGPEVNLKYIKDLQDIFDAVLYAVTAPRVGNDFKVINHVLDPENKVPCLGVAYECLPYQSFTQIGYNGQEAVVNAQNFINAAKNNLANPNYQTPIDFFYEKVNDYLNVKRVDAFSTTLITNLQLLVTRWLGEGARDNRAAAENTASNTINLMPNDVNLNLGYLDTFHIGRWLYGSYTKPSANNPNLYIVNLRDYIAYRNTSQPTNLPADTSLLALRSIANNNALLGKLCIFKDDDVNDLVILDYDNSTTQSNQDTYAGLPCRTVPWNTVGHMDSDLGLVLDNSLDKQTIQLALFLNVFHLPWNRIGIDQATDVWRLKLYKIPLQEALVRLFARKDNEKLRFLCSPQNGGVEKWKMMYSFRVVKTMFAQEIAKAKGCISFMSRHLTANNPRLLFATLNVICPGWEFETYLTDNVGTKTFELNNEKMLDRVNIFLPTWIPYEMFLNNIPKNKATTLVIDEPEYETGVEGNVVNTTFKFPRSFVTPMERTFEATDAQNFRMVLNYEGLGNYEDVNGNKYPEKFTIININTVGGVATDIVDFVTFCMSFPDTLPVCSASKRRVYHKVSDRHYLKYTKNNPYRNQRLLVDIPNL